MDTFADRLRYARQKRKFSQNALARASGLSQGAISSYETGNRKSAKEIFRLAQVLEVSAAWLSEGTAPMDPDAHRASGTRDASPSADITSVRHNRQPADMSGIVARTLREASPVANSDAWPFQELQESDYWSLSENERRLIDRVAATMAKTLRAR